MTWKKCVVTIAGWLLLVALCAYWYVVIGAGRPPVDAEYEQRIDYRLAFFAMTWLPGLILVLIGTLWVSASALRKSIVPVGESGADELINHNAAGVYLAACFGIPGFFLFYVMSSQLGASLVPFVVFWLGAVALPTALQLRRPWYPYRIGPYLVAPAALTTPQLRVLTFLRSPENRLSTIRIGFVLTIASGGTGALALAIPYPPDFPLAARALAGSSWPYIDLIFPTLFAALGSYIFQTGVACLRVRRLWTRIQGAFPPFPPASVSRAFYLGSRRRLRPDMDSRTSESNGIVTQTFGKRLTIREVCSIIAWLVGVPLVYNAFVRILVRFLREGASAGMPIAVALAIVGIVLVFAGSRLWHRR